jgi:ribosome-binding protein aMBF1 (putative translation factor)
MSGRTKGHLTKGTYKVIIETPSKEQIAAWISEDAFSKLQSFLKKHNEEDSIEWEKLAADRIKKYEKAGLALRGARFREGLSQKELAKRSGVSQENISRMENGQRVIGEEVAKKLAKALNINTSLLLAS